MSIPQCNFCGCADTCNTKFGRATPAIICCECILEFHENWTTHLLSVEEARTTHKMYMSKEEPEKPKEKPQHNFTVIEGGKS